MFLSYRSQSVDLQSKSSDLFLYDGNIGLYYQYFTLHFSTFVLIQLDADYQRPRL